jgi:hypothetical protein
MKKYFVMCVGTLAMMLTACKSHQSVTTTAFHNYTTECLGKSMDGSQTLRVWATGRNRTDAIEQAKKKAVFDVTFTGISAGGGECSAYPVVDEANARKKYKDYFDRFFADGGAYSKYVSIENQKKSAIDKFQGNGNQMYGIIVVVNRSALRQRFISDKIIIK